MKTANYLFLPFLRRVLLGLFMLGQPLVIWADEEKGGYNRQTLEYQQKYAVPAGLADTLWQYIQQKYSTTALKKLNPKFTSQVAYETYTDEYFDDARYTLLRHQGGLRYRLLFQGRTIAKEFIQLKLSRRPRNRNVREEYKFNVNDRPDKRSVHADHPFLRLIRQSDQRLVDSLLQLRGVNAQKLRAVMEITQHRRRLYLQDRGNDLGYISLDHAYSDNGTYTFYELELALNEVAYTTAKPTQRRQLAHILELLQLDLTNKFTALRQDQTPKYNKMYNLQNGHRIRPRLYNLAWLGIGLVLAGIGIYLYSTRNRPAPEPLEML